MSQIILFPDRMKTEKIQLKSEHRNITVEVERSKVILRGTVRSVAERKAAEDTA